MNRRIGPGDAAPWFLAFAIWFFGVMPLRVERGERLAEQSGSRRERLTATRAARDVEGLKRRVTQSLGEACVIAQEAAAQRQRVIALARDLDLDSFTLTVTGAPVPGAQIEAMGARPTLLKLLDRVGDPKRGAFLRVAHLREARASWTVSTSVGAIGGLASIGLTPGPCPNAQEPVAEPSPAPTPLRHAPIRIATPPPAPSPTIEASAPTPESLPFEFIAILRSSGRDRVSLKFGSEVRVVGVGEEVGGWTCVAIDADAGAVFARGGRRLVLSPRS